MRPMPFGSSNALASLLAAFVLGCSGGPALDTGAAPAQSAGSQDADPPAVTEGSDPAPATGQSDSPFAPRDLKRIPLPSPDGSEEPGYTIEVPLTWEVRRDLPLPGVLLGPPAGDPSSYPEMVLVRTSTVDVSEPEAVLEALRANSEQQEWELVEGEVRDFGETAGLWIVRRLSPSGFHGERINLAVKLPHGAESLDLVVTVPEEQMEELGPAVRQILGSVQATAGTPPKD